MKIVLLPGVDGTGELFAPLLPLLGKHSIKVISYPSTGKQDYETLMEYVKSNLPNEEYLLVAESFSGPIGVMLAKEGSLNLKGIVFVATFLSVPRWGLLSLFSLLPVKLLSKLSFAVTIYRTFMFGTEAKKSIISKFQSIIDGMPAETLRNRIQAIRSLKLEQCSIELPAVYIRPDSDRLIPLSKCVEFKHQFNNLVVRTIKGQHFILQTNPSRCAEIINCVPNFQQKAVADR